MVRADETAITAHNGETGYGIVEYGVGKGFAQYEAVQAHPPI